MTTVLSQNGSTMRDRGRADKVNVINEIAKRYCISKKLIVRIDGTAPTPT